VIAPLPGGSSDPDAGRKALVNVRTALEGLRPDLAVTVLIEAIGDQVDRVPIARRHQLWRAVGNLIIVKSEGQA
jgi:hypothetical protein